MAKRSFRVSEDLCQCVIADGKAGDQRLVVAEIGDGGALVETDIEFAVNEYIDVTIGFDGLGDEALFAHVVSSGDDGLRLRWLHFDPSESERLAKTLDRFGEMHGLEAEEVADEEPAPKKKRETRRIVRPRTSANVKSESRATRRVTKPSARVPAAGGNDDAFTDADAEAPESPEVKQPRRHETTSITPFRGTPTVDESSVKRSTRKVSRPSGSQAAVARGGGGGEAGGDEHGGTPFEETGEQAILTGTEQFRKMDGAAGPKVDDDAGAKPQTVTVRRNVVGQDGKLDVGASIRSRAKTVRASELAAKHDRVRVLNMSTIKELIQDAVQEALNRLGSTIDQAEKDRLLKEAEDEFQERLKAFKAEKQGWEAQQKNLENQLERAQHLLEDERNKVVEADQFTVSEQGMEDLEKRFNRLVNQAIKNNGVSGPLADELQRMVASLLDTERERIADQAENAQSEAIKLLEKKVARLAGSLEDSEKDALRAKRRAAALEAAGAGVSGQAVYSDFLDEEDKERKLELLRVVFDQNKEMRDQLKSKGIKIKGRKRPQPMPKEEAADVPAEEVEQEAAAAAPAAEEPVAEAPVVEEPVVEEPVAAATASADEDEQVSDDAYDDSVDPDDMPWVPGTRLETDIKGDNEDEAEAEGIKKIATPQDFEIPDLAALKARSGGGGAGDTDDGSAA